MKPLSPAERQKALDAFVPLDDEPQLEVVGRSELEQWANCPMAAHLLEQGKGGPLPSYVEAGEQTHQAIGKAIQTWIDTAGEIGPHGIREALEQALRGSRPDVQPQVIASARASVWSFSHFLAEINPDNILHFDGGEGERSGQLAIDIPTAGVRYTGEMDLGWSGPMRGVIQLEDWKSGFRYYRGGDVYQSFQFQSYAVLILENYPDIDAVEVRVWNLRQNTKTYPVMFTRDKLDQYMGRIHAALQARYENNFGPIPPQPWPAEDKCSRCRVARHCPAAGDIAEVQRDPQAALRVYIAKKASLAADFQLLAAQQKHHGPIELPTGERFAAEHKSKPKAQLIVPKGKPTPKEESGDDDSDGSEG